MTDEARYLALDERIVCRVRRHIAMLARPLAEAAGALAAAALLGALMSPRDGDDVVDSLLGLFALVFVARFAWRVWAWSIERVVVTDRRVFEVSGILTRRVSSMPLTKVTDMTYHRSFAGRILGFGELRLESPGQKQALARIAYLPEPDDFYRTVTSLVMAPTHEKREDLAAQVDEDDTGPLPRVIV